jgi:hypothetical protein
MKEPDNTERDDGELAKRARQLFDESVQELDAETLSRLNRSRQRALAHAKGSGAQAAWLRWTPVAAAAVAAAAVVIVLNPGNGVDELPRTTASDLELLLAEEELEMLEDLEFYRWMALEETAEATGQDDHVG